jgi:dienelactone hydrolase
LLLLFGPVFVTQLIPAQDRCLEGVSLDETQHRAINFRNTIQQLDLGGLLFVPSGEGPFPAVVVIHGSGTSARDNRWYLTLTRYLQENGVLVLLPDKRGSVKSQGDWHTADFHDLATDTLAAIDYLKEQAQVLISDIGVVGMSQGAWIAPIVASQSDDVAFVVTLVGSAVTPTEQLRYEENHNIRQMGFLPGISNVLALISTAYIRNVGQPEFWNGIADYDPIPYWQELSVDALLLYGSDDTNVPSEESAARLRELGNPAIRFEVYAGSGHPLEDPVGIGSSIIRRDALDDVLDFIGSVTGPGP